jgi:hypothetical protein
MRMRDRCVIGSGFESLRWNAYNQGNLPIVLLSNPWSRNETTAGRNGGRMAKSTDDNPRSTCSATRPATLSDAQRRPVPLHQLQVSMLPDSYNVTLRKRRSPGCSPSCQTHTFCCK